MARVRASNGDRIYKIEEWLGVNENPDGDTGLKLGEASSMTNFQITNSRKLQKRPGTQNIANLLQDYALDIAEEPTTILTEYTTSAAAFQAYPQLDVTDGGLPNVAGTPVTVNRDNLPDYQGYYYPDANGIIYQLGECVYEPGLDNGVPQYRWHKWSCTVSGGCSFEEGDWLVQSTTTEIARISGYSDYSFDSVSGLYSEAGSFVTLDNGSVYTGHGGSIYRITLQSGIMSTYRSAAVGPQSYSSYSKGSASYGYVYGPDGTYPDNTYRTDGGKYFWYDDKMQNATYNWRFYRAAIVADPGPSPVRGIWSGRIDNNEVICAACDGRLWGMEKDRIPNLVPNSRFTDGTSGWQANGVTGFTVSDGAACFTATSQNGALRQEAALSVETGHQYYLRGVLKSISSLVSLRFQKRSDPYTSVFSISGTGSGAFETLSGIGTASESASDYNVQITDGRSAGWTEIQAAEVFAVDLTALFGFGNEPSKEWCDQYISYSGDALINTDTYTSVWTRTDIGPLDTTNKVHFFGFNSKLYMLSGMEYKVWDGTTLSTVDGYRPLVAVAAPYNGGGTPLQRVNMLNGKRRVWFSPDGTHATLTLPEKNIAGVDYATDLATGAPLTISSVDLTNGTVTLTAPPAEGTNSIEIGYAVPVSLRSQIVAMTRAEFYNGDNDNRIFVYGDGSNKAYYSDLDYNGKPTAEYFPDLNVVSVGDANTPIYDLLRHYNELIAIKDGAAFTIRYGQITLASGALTAAFYVETVNKGIGGSGYGQAQLIENHPRTLDGRSIYEWVATTSSGGITSDQRNAQRISQKVEATIRELDCTKAMTFYDKINHEYYVVENGVAIVQNTENGAWYIYRNFPAVCMIVYKDEVYYGTEDGYIRHVSQTYKHDCWGAISCYWESGAEAFGKIFMRKYTDELYIVPKQEESAVVHVTLLTDEMAVPEPLQVVATGFFSFLELDFRHLSFNVSHQPKTHRKRFKARGYSWLRLMLSSVSTDTSITVLSASIKVRETGKVR